MRANKFTGGVEAVVAKVFQKGSKFLEYIDLLNDTTNKMCFVAGTQVHTDEGLVNIEDVQPGQLVLSRDPATGEQAYKPVLDTFVTHPDSLYTVTYVLPGVAEPIEAELVCTGEHPFYVLEDADFVPANELEIGDTLSMANGQEAVVAALDIAYANPGETFTTYNFEVEDFHTYFVGVEGVWVHNAGRWCDAVKGHYWLKRYKFEYSVENATKDAVVFLQKLKAKHGFSEKKYFEALGSLCKEAIKDPSVFPGGVPTNLWTKGRFKTVEKNIGFHFDKHVINNHRNSCPDGVTDIVTYFKNAHGYRTTYGYIDEVNLPVHIERKPQGADTLLMDFSNGNFSVFTPDGEMRTLFKAEGTTEAEWRAFWAKK